MTTEERAECAAQYKMTGQCNCCQAVIKAYQGELGIDDAMAAKLASGFAVGMGCMEATCGSLIGAVMLAGLRTGGNGTPRFSREILARFKELSGAVTCKDLKGVETGKVLCACDDCVRNAVRALEAVLPQQS